MSLYMFVQSYILCNGLSNNIIKNVENGAGEWWKGDIQQVLDEFLASGGDPNISDAFLINGQPGVLYNCSKNGTTWAIFLQNISCDAASLSDLMSSKSLFCLISNHRYIQVDSG